MQRTALTLVEGGLDAAPNWRWFCGHCAAPAPGGTAPAPSARVCTSCGLGLLLEVREDLLPDARDAFLVVDSQLLVQAMSREAQALLDLSEEMAVDRVVSDLLVPADAEAQGPTGFAAVVADAAAGRGLEIGRAVVRPWNTFGVRVRARIATCGPPRAALIVLGNERQPSLRAVPGTGDQVAGVPAKLSVLRPRRRR